MKYGLDNGACRNGAGTGDHIEVDTQLSAQQREHDEETDQDYQPVWLQPRNKRSSGLRENPNQNALVPLLHHCVIGGFGQIEGEFLANTSN